MWNCPACRRNFKVNNQSHYCETIDIGELFVGKPDELVVAFDDLLHLIASWKPNTFGASRHTVVFTSKKAWLIIKPMKKELDLKFYYVTQLDSPLFKTITDYSNKFAHHIRIAHPDQLSDEVMGLLRKGYEYSLK